MAAASMNSLDMLETETVQILRTVVGDCDNPVMLFSGGKDSLCMLHVARKAFAPGPVPFPMLHVDTGHNFPELIAFRDYIVEAFGLELIVASVQDWIDDGRLEVGPDGSRNTLQIPVLLHALQEGGYDVAMGGARRDEERARAKERVFSHRDAIGQWNPKQQRPELWSLWNTRLRKGENLRCFPLSNWTELDVWTYIYREEIELPGLYLAHERELVEREGLLLAVDALNPLREGESSFRDWIRFRTLGDLPLTGGMRSKATTVADVIAENLLATSSERGVGRGDDRMSSAAMEDRKREGYF